MKAMMTVKCGPLRRKISKKIESKVCFVKFLDLFFQLDIFNLQIRATERDQTFKKVQVSIQAHQSTRLIRVLKLIVIFSVRARLPLFEKVPVRIVLKIGTNLK